MKIQLERELVVAGISGPQAERVGGGTWESAFLTSPLRMLGPHFSAAARFPVLASAASPIRRRTVVRVKLVAQSHSGVWGQHLVSPAVPGPFCPPGLRLGPGRRTRGLWWAETHLGWFPSLIVVGLYLGARLPPHPPWSPAPSAPFVCLFSLLDSSGEILCLSFLSAEHLAENLGPRRCSLCFRKE